MSLIPTQLTTRASENTQLATPVAVVNVSFLNLRSGPGPQYTVLSQLVGGTTATILGALSDNSWLLVETPLGAGWVYSQYTLVRGDVTFIPVIESSGGGGPSLTAASPLYIGLGSAPTVTGSQVGQATLPIPALQTPTLIVNTSYLNVRSGPAGYFSVVTVIPGGNTLTPLGITSDGSWFLVSGPFGRGWVDQDYVLFRGIIGNVPIIYTY
ncbi:MAG: SH3 domain-containing protein [Anaerolineae bacterium]